MHGLDQGHNDGQFQGTHLIIIITGTGSSGGGTHRRGGITITTTTTTHSRSGSHRVAVTTGYRTTF